MVRRMAENKDEVPKAPISGSCHKVPHYYQEQQPFGVARCDDDFAEIALHRFLMLIPTLQLISEGMVWGWKSVQVLELGA